MWNNRRFQKVNLLTFAVFTAKHYVLWFFFAIFRSKPTVPKGLRFDIIFGMLLMLDLSILFNSATYYSTKALRQVEVLPPPYALKSVFHCDVNILMCQGAANVFEFCIHLFLIITKSKYFCKRFLAKFLHYSLNYSLFPYCHIIILFSCSIIYYKNCFIESKTRTETTRYLRKTTSCDFCYSPKRKKRRVRCK